MITRLEIENFKAIRKLAIDLGPLTVLVGPNDSGKTTILQALDILGRMIAYPIEQIDVFSGGGDHYFLDRDRARPMQIAVNGVTAAPFEVGVYRYSVKVGYHLGKLRVLEEELTWGDKAEGYKGVLTEEGNSTWTGEWTLFHLRHRSSGGFYAAVLADLSSHYVAFNPQMLAKPCALNDKFAADGSGLAALLHRMLIALDRRPVEALDAGLRRLSPHVNNVAVDTEPRGQVEALIALSPSRQGVYARDMSMGVLLTTGYLALMHGTQSRRFLIEQPENGVHPRALREIVEVMRSMTRDGRQVILTTHSPILLKFIDPEDIRIVTRSVDAGVSVTAAVDSPVFNELNQRIDFGELWYSLGDEAVVASKP